jgi:16S rRNA (adenine1518-N6/adenine1519-N6)-dimethyltransferase
MRAKRSLGQNFLQDEAIVERIVDALELRAGESVIEIGPGRGALTRKLLERNVSVTAIEFDRDMIAYLKRQFGNSLQLVEKDVLEVDFDGLITGKAKLVGNLPYNISTPILQRLIDQRSLFSTLVLMFQREVVERITAVPGTRERGYLTVLVEAAFHVERLFDVPAAAFAPMPKVWSAVTRLTPKHSAIEDYPLFRSIISVAFSQKRKTILNTLKPHFDNAASLLERAEIDPNCRAETLHLDEGLRLARTIAEQSVR